MDSEAQKLGEELRATMRLWANGVTVVTSALGKQRAGMTVSSFTSVSLEPPLVLICVFLGTETCNLIEESGVFAVSVLGAEHAQLSNQFAGFSELPEGADRFYNVATTTAESGCPILADSIAWVDCKVHSQLDAGTHRVIIGEVLAAQFDTEQPAPLIYFNRGYHTVKPVE